MEIWKNITELDSYYEISNLGNVRRKNRLVKSAVHKGGFRKIKAKQCALQNNGNGYLQLYVSVNKQRKVFLLHRLVAIYFIPNPDNLPEVNHKDGNKKNCRFDNLEWNTHLENQQHASQNDLMQKGEKHFNVKLSEQKIIAIRRLHRMNPKFNRSAIARKLGIKNPHIIKIITNQRWKHLSIKIKNDKR